jgi:hypothetical protein
MITLYMTLAFTMCWGITNGFKPVLIGASVIAEDERVILVGQEDKRM